MDKRKTTYRYSPKKQRKAIQSMPKWKAWLLIGVLAGLAGLLLWYGLAIEVRCERISESRVDVTVERRFCRLIPISSTTVTDVVKADVYYVWARTSSGGRQTRGFTEALELSPRNGPGLRRARFGPSVGTLPRSMVDKIVPFMDDPSTTSIKIWWMPWLVNIAAIPFLLFVGGVVGENVWRAFQREA